MGYKTASLGSKMIVLNLIINGLPSIRKVNTCNFTIDFKLKF